MKKICVNYLVEWRMGREGGGKEKGVLRNNTLKKGLHERKKFRIATLEICGILIVILFKNWFLLTKDYVDPISGRQLHFE